MRALRLSVVAVAAVLLSCGGGSHPPGTLSSTWVAPPILANVPAETPYLFASLEPTSEQLRRRMSRPFDHAIVKLMAMADGLRDRDRSTLDPGQRAGLALADELRGKDVTHWWRDLGFTPDARFAVYGLSMWPVLRIEVANPARLRGVVEHVLSAAGGQAKRGTLDGHAYWFAGSAEVTAVAAVLDREAVVAVLPTPALPTALPLVLGTRAPAHSLGGATTVTDLLSKYRLLGFTLGYIDAHRAVDILTAPQPSELDALLHSWTGPISPACHADLDRLAAAVPRAVFGYRRLDDAGFDGGGIIETSPGVAAALRKLHTTMPEVAAPVTGHPLFAFGVAINPDGLVSWLRDIAGQLHDHPLACPWLAGVNAAGQQLATSLAAPLPPMVRGLRGFSLVVDEATIKPLNIVGHLLVAGDHIADLVTVLGGKLSAIAGIQLNPDGRPVAIPTERLGIPIRSVHVAMTADRLVVATGESSAQRATNHLASATPARSPLFVLAFDGPGFQKLMASLGRSDAADFSSLGTATTTFDVVSDGLSFDVSGTWDESSLAQPAAPR
jgi:hypothetical protein